MPELLGLSPQLYSKHGFQPCLASRRTNRALKLRSSQAMKKPVVHRGAVQSPKRSAVRIRQNRLAAKFGGDRTKASRNLVKRFVPGDAPPGLFVWEMIVRDRVLNRWSEAPLPRHRPLCSNPPHGIQHAVRRVHAIQILRHFGAQESTRDRMRRIALDLSRPPVLHGDQNSASIRAIMGTSGMNHFLHRS